MFSIFNRSLLDFLNLNLIANILATSYTLLFREPFTARQMPKAFAFRICYLMSKSDNLRVSSKVSLIWNFFRLYFSANYYTFLTKNKNGNSSPVFLTFFSYSKYFSFFRTLWFTTWRMTGSGGITNANSYFFDFELFFTFFLIFFSTASFDFFNYSSVLPISMTFYWISCTNPGFVGKKLSDSLLAI